MSVQVDDQQGLFQWRMMNPSKVTGNDQEDTQRYLRDAGQESSVSGLGFGLSD
eukprot:CAMPEP_0173390920 /NCGR_PEP_ID=MMETSP1356-20130122/16585_1 /TAXON_ID=77927 ORGANISM="Hemiselmis virescens, Strain PCC157" /NCGR_SAMPLE_ID=MMETSP1356 /ASSEMBLY_ACC=CAM_ASM_000847 /LENGTH=52 /DNA_ID=CAMNT_0014348417 /DNA_START=100 /DNA_END=255 /DNA_ORIENTATION=-